MVRVVDSGCASGALQTLVRSLWCIPVVENCGEILTVRMVPLLNIV